MFLDTNTGISNFLQKHAALPSFVWTRVEPQDSSEGITMDEINDATDRVIAGLEGRALQAQRQDSTVLTCKT